MSAAPPPHPNSDVRMRGFASRSTVEMALAWIDSVLPEFARLPTESVTLWNAAGRVLATDVVSSVNVPSFARSMMDGYAVREPRLRSSHKSVSAEVRGEAGPQLATVDARLCQCGILSRKIGEHLAQSRADRRRRRNPRPGAHDAEQFHIDRHRQLLLPSRSARGKPLQVHHRS